MRRVLMMSALALAACDATGPENASPDSAAAQGGAPATGRAPGAWSIDAGGDLNSFFECLEKEKITLASAHRGGPGPGFPENALATLEETMKNGAAILEVDIATSSDGVLFLFHDEVFDEKTTGSGAPNARRWAEIEGYRLKDALGRATKHRPTRLVEALQWAEGRSILALDIKQSTRYEDVADIVRQEDAVDRILLIAYTTAQAAKLHRLLPDAMISLNVLSQSDLNRAVADGIPQHAIIGFTGLEEPNPRLFDTLNARDVEVIFGTLGGEDSHDADAERAGNDAIYVALAEMGVDLIATDRPAAVAAALQAAGRAARPGVCGVNRNE
jgi:glycerophosphoryl diester phosphodiesterase